VARTVDAGLLSILAIRRHHPLTSLNRLWNRERAFV
jgi:hypothetical protein